MCNNRYFQSACNNDFNTLEKTCWASAVVQHFIMDGVLQAIDKAVSVVEDDCW